MPLIERRVVQAYKTGALKRQVFGEVMERLMYPASEYKFRKSFGLILERRMLQDPVFRTEFQKISRTPSLPTDERNRLCCIALDASLKRRMKE